MRPNASLILEKMEEMIVLLKQIVKDPTASPALHKEPPISIQEAAVYLQLSRSRVYTLVYTGKLKTLQNRKRGRMLFSISDLQAYLVAKHRPYKQ